MSVCLGSASVCPRFSVHVFYLFFFLPAFVDFGRQLLLLWTVYALFTYCAYTVHVLKNIKNGSYDTIYTFKNDFTTVFSVFSSSNNKFNPNGPWIEFIVRQWEQLIGCWIGWLVSSMWKMQIEKVKEANGSLAQLDMVRSFCLTRLGSIPDTSRSPLVGIISLSVCVLSGGLI